MEHQVFGPHFMERLADVCNAASRLGYDEECAALYDLQMRQEEPGKRKFEAIPTRLLKHYTQTYLAKRF